MSVEDITITNAELASAMARGAVKQTELEMATIDRRVREMQGRSNRLFNLLYQHACVKLNSGCSSLRYHVSATTASRASIIEAEGQARAIDIMVSIVTESSTC